MRSALARALAAFLACSAAAASATPPETDLEGWFSPSLTVGLSGRTSIELEGALRLRDDDRAPGTTNYGRLWLKQGLGSGFTLGLGVERRLNAAAADETRLLQQVSARHSVWRGRVRLEQRMVDRAAQTGWRLRTRAGIEVPLDSAGAWAVFADAEPFFTLRATSRTGSTGLTGLRTQLGLERELGDHVAISLGWVRQQDIVRGAPDRIGNAPILGIDLSF